MGKELAASKQARESRLKFLKPCQQWNTKVRDRALKRSVFNGGGEGVNQYSDPQDEFLDALYWLRQGLCLLLGVIWGIIPLQGFVGLTL